MKITQTIGAAVLIASGSMAYAGAVVDLQPSQLTDSLSGIINTQMSELIGVSLEDSYHEFSIGSQFNDGRGDNLLYQGTFMTRVVRSNQSGNLHFNYRFMNPNSQLAGEISHVEITGFEGFQTRVEYRNETTSATLFGPQGAERSNNGSMIDFSFDLGLSGLDESKYFFAMTDTDTYYNDAATATIYLTTGESVSLSIVGANPAVPAPGALGLLAATGLISTRRRR